MLSRIAQMYEFRPTQCEDLLQDIALAIWRALPSWRGESSVKTFIARVAHNRAVDHVINQRRHGHLVQIPETLEDSALGPEAVIVQSDQHDRLMEAVRRLPLGQRQVITLALEGFQHAEIAATLGLAVGNVDVRLVRARQALKAALGENDDR